MQADRSAGAARLAGTVRGLGVCDVLRIEFAAVQRPGLVAALATRVRALERPRPGAAVVSRGRAYAVVDDEGQDRTEQVRLLTRIGASVPESAIAPFTITGPAGLMSRLVADAVAAAVRDLAAQLGEGGAHAPGTAMRDAQLQAAGAWIATALDCRAVEAFCFDAGLDPAHAW